MTCPSCGRTDDWHAHSPSWPPFCGCGYTTPLSAWAWPSGRQERAGGPLQLELVP